MVIVSKNGQNFLYVGGIMGSILYAIVIMSVIYYDLDLLVGHTGLLNPK